MIDQLAGHVDGPAWDEVVFVALPLLVLLALQLAGRRKRRTEASPGDRSDGGSEGEGAPRPRGVPPDADGEG